MFSQNFYACWKLVLIDFSSIGEELHYFLHSATKYLGLPIKRQMPNNLNLFKILNNPWRE